MTEVISVRFRGGCKEYYFDPHGIAVEPNQFVIVETAQGLEYAQCVSGNHEVEDDSVVQPLRPLVRVATENDDRTYAYNKTREKNAFEVCQKKIAERGLDMKLVRVESNFDGSKIIFFFTSDGRVDFRELVRDLAGVFRARIELRQIGVRDEAKMLGGLGICGRPFCCSQFLDDFVPVSIKMAKTQNLSLNPTKISGTCGRLMCCLKYEQEAYEELTKNVPKQGAFVETPAGYGIVTQVNLLRQMVKVKLDGEGDDTVKTYRAVEVAAVPGGRPKDGETPPSVLKYIPEPEEEEEEQDIWKLPQLFADDDAAKEKESTQEQKKRSRSRRSRRGGKTPQSDAKPAPQSAQAPSAEEKKTTAKPKPRNHRGGGKKPAEQSVSAEQPKPQQQAKSPDGEKKRSNRRYYHRGKPKNKGGQAQNQ